MNLSSMQEMNGTPTVLKREPCMRAFMDNITKVGALNVGGKKGWRKGVKLLRQIEELTPIPIAARVWERIHVDAKGDIILPNEGFRYVARQKFHNQQSPILTPILGGNHAY